MPHWHNNLKVQIQNWSLYAQQSIELTFVCKKLCEIVHVVMWSTHGEAVLCKISCLDLVQSGNKTCDMSLMAVTSSHNVNE